MTDSSPGTVEYFCAHVDRWLAVNGQRLIEMRRDFHSHPELSRQEIRTTEIIVTTLSNLGLTPRRLPNGTGVICDLGNADSTTVVGLRADMDALPIAENTGLSFSSTVPGVSHACGHDAHTAVLLGVAETLVTIPDLPIGVRLIFQPAEEVMPGGALDAIAADATVGLSAIYALHCDPKLPAGQVGVRVGAITSAADHIELQVNSAGGHTSRPQLTGDLVHALSSVVVGLPTILSRRIDPRTGTVVSFGAIHAGDAPNAIPQEGIVRGTARTADHATWELLEPIVQESITAILTPLNVSFVLNYKRGVPPVVNDSECVQLVREAVADISESALADTAQSGGAEDFSWYLEEIPGAMARLGVGKKNGNKEVVDLHQPGFDLAEEALEIGVKTFTNIVFRHAVKK